MNDWSAEDTAALKLMVEAGHTCFEIGQALGRSEQSVRGKRRKVMPGFKGPYRRGKPVYVPRRPHVAFVPTPTVDETIPTALCIRACSARFVADGFRVLGGGV